jgi:hypothetical protein
MKGFRLLHNFPLSQAYPGAMRITVRAQMGDLTAAFDFAQ